MARKVLEGFVVSDRMDKTVLVEIKGVFRHPVFGKTVRKTKRYMAHDEENACRVGDRVRIMESRPLSRHKRWRVLEILEREEMVAHDTASNNGGSGR